MISEFIRLPYRYLFCISKQYVYRALLITEQIIIFGLAFTSFALAANETTSPYQNSLKSFYANPLHKQVIIKKRSNFIPKSKLNFFKSTKAFLNSGKSFQINRSLAVQYVTKYGFKKTYRIKTVTSPSNQFIIS